MNGRHYSAAVSFADYLSPIPGLVATILFGSVARGEERDDSDIDLILVHSPSLTKHGFDQAVRQHIGPIRDWTRPLGDHVRLKAGALGLDNPPPFQLLRRSSIPRRWEDAALDGDAVRVLWSINGAADLVERRRRGKPFAMRTYKDGAAIVWHSHPPVDSTNQDDVGQSLHIYTATATVEVWADCALYIGQAECVVHQVREPDGPVSSAIVELCWRGGKEPPTSIRRRMDRLLDKWTKAVLVECFSMAVLPAPSRNGNSSQPLFSR
ncbi:MAG: nucleotidyltransferase domain-containing protein [Bacteroidota bacterium]